MPQWVKRLLLLLIVVVLLIILILLRYCGPGGFDWRNASECPAYWTDTLRSAAGPDSLLVPLSGRLRDVPEYNDCQRLAPPPGSDEYGPLAAVFAASGLATLQSRIDNAGTGRAVAAATILAIDEDYPSLGLRKGVNCLYVWQESGSWRARMLSVSDEGQSCLDIRGVANTAQFPAERSKDLVVTPPDVAIPEPPGPLPPGDRPLPLPRELPAVARWEPLDGGGQAIGFRCHTQWCIVAPSEVAVTSVLATPESGELDGWLAGLPGEDKRAHPLTTDELMQFAVLPGWRDEQLLAPPNGGDRPSAMRAVVIPHPDLDTIGNQAGTAAFNTWRLTAFVWIPEGTDTRPTLEGYGRKFNYAQGWNAISICSTPTEGGCQFAALPELQLPDAGSCPLQGPTADRRFWYAMIQPRTLPANASQLEMRAAKTFCIRRCERSGDVIGTARWRWVKRDETVWTRCASGCCEVEQ